MKLSNIFKKSTNTVAKANVQKLEKNQLEKVVGGIDTTTSTTSPCSEKVNAGLHTAGSAVVQ